MMRWIWAAILLLFAVHAVALYVMGQPVICACGHVDFWHGIVTDSENSQHLFDWYTLSHIIHGILFYAGLSFLFPRLSVGTRLVMAFAIESGWELFENTDMIINRYREQALAQGYFGDSIVNSTGDMLAALGGFLIAWRVPMWGSIITIIALEGLALYFIRDSLMFNIIQLIHPIDAIGAWQAGK